MTVPVSPWRQCSTPLAMRAGELRVRLHGISLGERCELRAGVHDATVVGSAVVNRIEDDVVTLAVMSEEAITGAGVLAVPTGRQLDVKVGFGLLGTVLNGMGEVVDRLVDFAEADDDMQQLPIGAAPIDYRLRRGVTSPFVTGIRSIDALLTVGVGQRVGVFAAAGSGKTTLLEMLLGASECDVRVIALIGERGREVVGFVDAIRESGVADRTIIVQATSDSPAATRVNAAMVATKIAEFFRGIGANVLLLMDSTTRYARALRDMALAAGEPPARRGYPASVFEALPRLLERPGNVGAGSITAFYTVLLEEEEESDAIGEEVKSLLDGHIHLSGRLAQRGHFPAIDVLRSASRLFLALTTQEQRHSVGRVRELLSRLEDLQLLRDIGEYKPGARQENDDAVRREPALMEFLRQPVDQAVAMEVSLEQLHVLAR